ncbi:MAG: hypothetical protein NWR72_12810 [Bacteroidia bacterium]|nr:hypothetical protein [Bacteroidia bacterium]
MEYRFDLLFQIQITHPGLMEVADGWEIRPTADCTRNLRRFGMIFKATPDGGMIAAERRLPSGLPARPITETTAFRFLLKLKKPSILETTEGFGTDVPFPQFIGRSSLAYFSNLDDSNTLDGRVLLARSGTYVGKSDLGSVAAQTHAFEAAIGATAVNLVPILPGGGPAITRPVSAGRQVQLAETPPGAQSPTPLPAGAWKVKQVGSTLAEETLFTDDSLLFNRAFGLIEIFKNPAVDYDSPLTYLIPFNTTS